jgi:hypothetical protein
MQLVVERYLGVDVIISPAHSSEVGREGSGSPLLAAAECSAPLAGAIRSLQGQPAGLASSALGYEHLQPVSIK